MIINNILYNYYLGVVNVFPAQTYVYKYSYNYCKYIYYLLPSLHSFYYT